MQTKPLMSEISEFFENKKYKLKISAVENYKGSERKGHLITLATYFYPEKDLIKKTGEFNQVFKKYCDKLSIKYKKTPSSKKAHIQEYVVDKTIVRLGYNMQDRSYYFMFTSYGNQPKVSQKEIDKIKELFNKFRDLLAYEGCKSERLDIIINKLTKHWLYKNRNGLLSSERLDSFLKIQPKNQYRIKDEIVDNLVEEYVIAERNYENDNSRKKLFDLLEEVKNITKPLSLILSKKVILSKKCDDENFLNWCESELEKYGEIRKELLKKINQDPKQEKLRKYKEDYVEVISELHYIKTKKKRLELIKQARKIAKKFDYNPEKDLQKYQ